MIKNVFLHFLLIKSFRQPLYCSIAVFFCLGARSFAWSHSRSCFMKSCALQSRRSKPAKHIFVCFDRQLIWQNKTLVAVGFKGIQLERNWMRTTSYELISFQDFDWSTIFLHDESYRCNERKNGKLKFHVCACGRRGPWRRKNFVVVNLFLEVYRLDSEQLLILDQASSVATQAYLR